MAASNYRTEVYINAEEQLAIWIDTVGLLLELRFNARDIVEINNNSLQIAFGLDMISKYQQQISILDEYFRDGDGFERI